MGGDHLRKRDQWKELEPKKENQIDGKEKQWSWRCRWILGGGGGEATMILWHPPSVPPSSAVTLSVSSTSRKLFKPPATTHTHTLPHTFLASRGKLFRVFTQALDFSTVLRLVCPFYSTSILHYYISNVLIWQWGWTIGGIADRFCGNDFNIFWK